MKKKSSQEKAPESWVATKGAGKGSGKEGSRERTEGGKEKIVVLAALGGRALEIEGDAVQGS